ncbi:MAG: PVC-type heme-binding CxxCH protein [Limisphaerales bacterium]
MRILVCLLGLAIVSSIHGADISGAGAKTHQLLPWPRMEQPDIAPTSPEAATNLKRIPVPKGFNISLWAAEPMLANPVAFCLDEKGRVFVAETYRYRTSVLDIRHYMFMLEEDLACRTVQDRVQMARRNFGPQFDELELETEVIRLLEDRDGDGKADFSSVYADKFNTSLDGIASGVLARKGKVYFTNIPHLWKLEGIDENGRAKSRESLSYGYGVRFSFTGHDMHGLAIGPDGKLYFSIGDRGATVVTKEMNLLPYPDEGAVFRCNLDGTGMEVVHRGLRNPQELAFDNYGNLFTGDNDFDHGDEERLVQIAEGGDSGWRVGYQHAPLGFDLVPWKYEHIWISHNSRQAHFNGVEVETPIEDIGVRPTAYLPPVSNIGNGPSGLVYYPGTGMPSKYDNHFFLCHFKGNIVNSKIQAFSVKPKGATFELDNSEVFTGMMQPTDLEFGPDGALYFADWGQGWTRQRKGRIYRIAHNGLRTDAVATQTKEIFGEGFEQRPERNLIGLLGHRDRRIRQEAHLELAARGKDSIEALTDVAENSGHQLARIHAIWALGIISRDTDAGLESIDVLLGDEDAEIRAQIARVFGWAKYGDGVRALSALLKDGSARVRYYSAMALGQIGEPRAVPALVHLLAANDDADPYVRHAAVMGLVGTANPRQLVAAGVHRSAAVRMGALLALRKLGRSEIEMFLHERNPELIIEAARAINDAPIEGAQEELAGLVSDLGRVPEKFRTMLAVRAINANFRIGGADEAVALAKLVADQTSDPAMRSEALFALGTWGSPHDRDRVMGIYRPLGKRDTQPAIDALGPIVDDILKSAPHEVQLAAIEAVENLGLKSALSTMATLVRDENHGPNVRSAALITLAAMDSPGLNSAIESTLRQANEELRATAVSLVGHLDQADALKHIRKALKDGATPERQQAFTALATLKDATADRIVGDWMGKLAKGEVAGSLQLDVLSAAERRSAANIKQQVAAFTEKQAKAGELEPWKISLAGGNAERGEDIFYNRRDVQCRRCHKIDGSGGEAGPELTGIGSKQSREYLLEAIVLPSAKIAEGFENVQVETDGGPEEGGAEFAGVVKRETKDELELVSFEDGTVVVEKKRITFRRKGLSGMPVGLHAMLGKRNLRDLIEFLARLK